VAVLQRDESVFTKLELIEKAGFKLSAEILSTGEAAVYIEDGDLDYEIEICLRRNFKKVVCKMITNFDICTPKMFFGLLPGERVSKI